jgi:hypothetical protein
VDVSEMVKLRLGYIIIRKWLQCMGRLVQYHPITVTSNKYSMLLTSLDNLKDKVCRMNPHTEEELKKSIQRENLQVPQEELLQVNLHQLKQYRVRVHVHRHYFQHLLRYR